MQTKIEVSKTAKPVMAVKYVTSQPSFWQKMSYGNRQTPLAHNESARLFLNEEDINNAEKRPDIKQIKTVSSRERWINKQYEKYIKENNYQQVIILGAGFDIRAYKKNIENQKDKKNAPKYAQVRFWEIDKAEILDEKENIFKGHGLDKNATYLRADYTKEDFIQILTSSNIDFQLPTLIIWEGNTMYLEKEQILLVIQKLKLAFSEFSLLFDYFEQKTIDSLAPNSVLKNLWKTGINDINEFVKQNDLMVLTSQNIGELEIHYGVDNAPCERAMQYSLCDIGQRPF
ncbi:class I SAM-dependent methyltransferase [Legionella jamestowniensis]|uniref:Leucine carboxyl methyltransferase n=1 Tax=Legionella jamestowniensis TaxID=455 RepID=A0A0W0UPY1_9GAMM|nr:class I SAM-dependent methyltransferase [Legionella jamestowniensis]KTD09529.1 Leucine carboxyl methyltransferase [Legionella jamestowniensis]SFL90751.1 methyltransferase, TIGR00027 family [Legionella jamestowniensis DSM 19215]